MTSILSSTSTRGYWFSKVLFFNPLPGHGFNPQHVYVKGFHVSLSRNYIIVDPFFVQRDDSGAQNGEEDRSCTYSGSVVVPCDNLDS
jgi:hypothetical protein